MCKRLGAVCCVLMFLCFGAHAQEFAGSETSEFHIAAAVPKIKAGLVRWHESFATALRSADKSGKPVLLFQLVGNLDEALC